MTEHLPKRPAPLGAIELPDGSWQFSVWAPLPKIIEIKFAGDVRLVPMERDDLGYHRARVSKRLTGAKYLYRLDGSSERPDPASRYQPDGVHGPSQLIDVSAFDWHDSGWKGISLEDTVLYELHVGTFTPEGTLSAIVPRLGELADLGITTIELMPIAQFPGNRNWGYDGVFPFALQNTYGTPRDLQALVAAAHAKGLAVALDAVYNHLGPEGNYLGEYGPYFTDFYKTPWGSALNFDGPQNDEVRHFFIQSALYWLKNYHIDALRLDAVHSIYDASAYPFLAELSDAVADLSKKLDRKIHLIAESDLNDAKVVRSVSQGGLGMDAQWSDDFHHSLHTLLTGEKTGYYSDFGKLCHLAKTLQNGWFYAGQYAQHRQRRHGNSPVDSKPSHFVVCNQNHDQIGNRAVGDRLSTLVDFESLKLAAGVTVLSRFVPLLFMGEEYGETAPFQYFTSHGDPALAEAVSKGRQEEFVAFGWSGKIPDPQSEATFEASKLHHELAGAGQHLVLHDFYRASLELRREMALSTAKVSAITQFDAGNAVMALYESQGHLLAMIFNFHSNASTLPLNLPAGIWETKIDSASELWQGLGSSLPSRVDSGGSKVEVTIPAHSLAVLERVESRDPSASKQ
jgi:maltooligosyltrehalose trehalohydrolase